MQKLSRGKIARLLATPLPSKIIPQVVSPPHPLWSSHFELTAAEERGIGELIQMSANQHHYRATQCPRFFVGIRCTDQRRRRAQLCMPKRWSLGRSSISAQRRALIETHQQYGDVGWDNLYQWRVCQSTRRGVLLTL